jgi:hypothetical protein
MTKFGTPRYFKRRENNGYWTLVPLQGPFAADSVIVNDFTERVLDLVEQGNSLTGIFDTLRAEQPDGDERKLRVDLFHAVSRLKSYDFVDGGGFAENLEILKNGRKLVAGSLQPCPLEHVPVLAEFMRNACDDVEVHWLYNFFGQRTNGEAQPVVDRCLYDTDRMTESQATGLEIHWAYVDAKGQLVGGLSSTNYMQMVPVVSVSALAAVGDPGQRTAHGVAMLGQLAEILSLFGVNQKLRITSCPALTETRENMALFAPELPQIMARSRFKRSAVFPREMEGRCDVELFDRVL